jgi:hypothetical protein
LTSLMAVSDSAASRPCDTFLVTSHFSANAWTIAIESLFSLSAYADEIMLP